VVRILLSLRFQNRKKILSQEQDHQVYVWKSNEFLRLKSEKVLASGQIVDHKEERIQFSRIHVFKHFTFSILALRPNSEQDVVLLDCLCRGFDPDRAKDEGCLLGLLAISIELDDRVCQQTDPEPN
jgi:hypothetical protein